MKVICNNCGVEFYRKPSRVAKRNYCSYECRYINLGTTNEVQHHCLNCGKSFMARKSAKRKYCSRVCMSASWSKKVTKVCRTCGKKFEIRPSEYDVRFHCDKYCYGQNDIQLDQIDPTINIAENAKLLGVSASGLSKALLKNNISIQQRSVAEKLVEHWLNVHNIDYVFNKTFRLDGKSYVLDFMVGNIGIEVNPTFTHTPDMSGTYMQGHITPNYHADKSKWFMENHGIRVIHLFEKDFEHLDLFLHELLPKKKIMARKCELVDGNFREFILENHRQGLGNASNGVGLKYDGEIVAVMTFGKSRNKSKFEYELKRYTVKKGVSVVGGAQRLFKNWLKQNPHVKSVGSYNDLCYNSGEVYERLGFTLSHVSAPNYKWVKGADWQSRENCQRHKLSNKFGKDEYLDKYWTEKSIMMNEGFVRVFDCGNSVYVMNID